VRVPLPLTVLAALALVAACGGPAGGSNQPTGAATSPPAGATATTGVATATPPAGGGSSGGGTDANNVSCNDGAVGNEVSIVDFSFEPATVAADADGTVNWTNNGSATHTVTFDNGKDCGSLASGDTLTVLFLAPGTYTYHCEIHKSMKGTVTVGG
jgi:plastocyanin